MRPLTQNIAWMWFGQSLLNGENVWIDVTKLLSLWGCLTSGTSGANSSRDESAALPLALGYLALLLLLLGNPLPLCLARLLGLRVAAQSLPCPALHSLLLFFTPSNSHIRLCFSGGFSQHLMFIIEHKP